MANLMLARSAKRVVLRCPSIAGLARETRIECDSLRMVVSGTTLGFLTAFQLAQNFHHRRFEISMTVNQSPPEKRTHASSPAIAGHRLVAHTVSKTRHGNAFAVKQADYQLAGETP